jgi:hypothetical protein
MATRDFCTAICDQYLQRFTTTTMTTPDYRAALAEMIEAVDRLLGQGESPGNPGSRLILTVHVEDLGEIAERARALLTAPEAAEPQGPSNDFSARFREASLPLIKWLAENVHPHHTAIVTGTGAELLQGELSTGEVLDYLRD